MHPRTVTDFSKFNFSKNWNIEKSVQNNWWGNWRHMNDVMKTKRWTRKKGIQVYVKKVLTIMKSSYDAVDLVDRRQYKWWTVYYLPIEINVWIGYVCACVNWIWNTQVWVNKVLIQFQNIFVKKWVITMIDIRAMQIISVFRLIHFQVDR